MLLPSEDAPRPATIAPQVQLLRGDYLDILPSLTGQKIAFAFADLPYAATANSWDVAVDCDTLWKCLMPVLGDRRWACFTADFRLGARLYAANPKWYRHDLVWHKKGRPSGFLHARHCALRAHEMVLLFAKKQGVYNPQFTEGKPHNRHLYSVEKSGGVNYHAFMQKVKENKGTRHPVSILEVPKVHGTQLHPTQKPVDLLAWLLRSYTNENDTVLDFCSGSATTAIAALRTGRNVICIEKDPTYFEVGRKRVAEEQARLGFPVTV